jgi:hypothetical protein
LRRVYLAGGGGGSGQGGGAPLDSRLLCYARAVQQAGEGRNTHEYAPQQYTIAVNYEAGNGAAQARALGRKRAYYVMLFGVRGEGDGGTPVRPLLVRSVRGDYCLAAVPDKTTGDRVF